MKFLNKKYIVYFLVVFSISISVLVSFNLTTRSQASSDDKVYGWGWSENIGWISFNNCPPPGFIPSDCRPGADYGVTYDNGGNISGYAWSENIGWIKFGGLSGMPGAGSNAKISVNGSVTEFSGFARACAGTVDGKCSTMADSLEGWDGWILLDGAKFNTYNGNAIMPSYSWGSDVIGWIDFKYVKVKPAPLELASAEISGPTCVTSPTVELTWSSSGIKPNGCDINGISVVENVSNQTGTFNMVGNSTIFTLRCYKKNTGSPGELYSDLISVEKKAICNPTTVDKKPKYIER